MPGDRAFGDPSDLAHSRKAVVSAETPNCTILNLLYARQLLCKCILFSVPIIDTISREICQFAIQDDHQLPLFDF